MKTEEVIAEFSQIMQAYNVGFTELPPKGALIDGAILNEDEKTVTLYAFDAKRGKPYNEKKSRRTILDAFELIALAPELIMPKEIREKSAQAMAQLRQIAATRRADRRADESRSRNCYGLRPVRTC